MVAAILLAACVSLALGGQADGAPAASMQSSPQWRAGRFNNPQPIWTDLRLAWWRFLSGPSTPAAVPDAPVPVLHTAAAALATPAPSGLRVTWFGHASALLEIDGGKVLIDPFWGERASPVGWAGPKRWYAPPLALAALPAIDAVLISHDHYDHLDQASIRAMQAWATLFVVPLGVGKQLQAWGIAASRIIELDWWQSARVGGLELVATPARHASGRLLRKNQTLWAGYAIIGAQHRAWYSGDTGFHAGLADIGERLGPFDVTLIEAGQYDANWPDTHLGPEQAVEAHLLVRGKSMIPVHWGLLKLAGHGWTEPVERVLAAARCRAVEVLAPRPGQSVEPDLHADIAPWWPRIAWARASEHPVVATRNGLPSERVVFAPCPDAAR